jgi:hypothetical protein
LSYFQSGPVQDLFSRDITTDIPGIWEGSRSLKDRRTPDTTTDLTAVWEVPELAESGPAAGDEHFAEYRNNY